MADIAKGKDIACFFGNGFCFFRLINFRLIVLYIVYRLFILWHQPDVDFEFFLKIL